MLKNLSLVATAALFAGALTLLPAFAPQVAADTPQAMAKSDQLPMKAFGAGCSQRAWPYYEPSCLRDGGGQARAVRLVSTDRLSEDPRLAKPQVR